VVVSCFFMTVMTVMIRFVDHIELELEVTAGKVDPGV
jgi:hypothetical protein